MTETQKNHNRPGVPAMRWAAQSIAVLLALSSMTAGQESRPIGTRLREDRQQEVVERQEALAKLEQRTGKTVKMHVRPAAGTPRQIKGAILQRAVVDVKGSEDAGVQTARMFLRTNGALLGIDDPDAEMSLAKLHRCQLGREHLRFSQEYRGIPVWPSDLIVHLDNEGNVDLMDGVFVRTPRTVSTEPVLDAETAVARARSAVRGGDTAKASEPRLIIYAPGGDNESLLAWKMELSVSLQLRWLVVVDATTGETLMAYNQVMDAGAAGSGVDLWGETRDLNVLNDDGTYYMIDTSKQMFDPAVSYPNTDDFKGAIIVLDAENREPDANGNIELSLVISPDPDSWIVPDAVSAAYGLSETYDYYLERHSRDSIDGNGGTMKAVVRYLQGLRNAFWNGEFMVFGDARPYAGAIDVVAHELTHGITQNESDLIYHNQPGALNEAISDIFGEVVEAYTYGRPDWLKHAELGDSSQDYADPRSVEQIPGVPNPSKMSEFVPLPDTEDGDSGGVHINSSIINHCFYLLAEGMDGAIGIEDAAQIFYRANTVHLVQNSQFFDARLACIQSAEELFGTGSTTARKTAEAFDAVEIFDGEPEPCSDRDGDDTCDEEDNCPETYNPGQLDSDSDGIGDVCDDMVPPTVTSISPCDGCTENSVHSITIDFSKAIDVTRVVELLDFEVWHDGDKVYGGSLSWSNNSQRLSWFSMSDSLLAPGRYSVRLEGTESFGFRDIAGNALDGDNDGRAGGDYTTAFEIPGFEDDIDCDAGLCGTCPPLPLLAMVAGMIGVGAGNGRRRRR